MNNDLISRYALKKTFDEYGEKAKFTQGACQQLIDNAPPIEYTFEEAFQETVCENKLYCPARPHGKWLLTYPYQDRHEVHRECSVCGDARYIDDREYFVNDKHCPECGAKMDGGVK